jgi:putative endonuclease
MIFRAVSGNIVKVWSKDLQSAMASSLVYFETFPTAEGAIHRENRIKKYPRAWKLNLIAQRNPDWRDLAETLNG